MSLCLFFYSNICIYVLCVCGMNGLQLPFIVNPSVVQWQIIFWLFGAILNSSFISVWMGECIVQCFELSLDWKSADHLFLFFCVASLLSHTYSPGFGGVSMIFSVSIFQTVLLPFWALYSERKCWKMSHFFFQCLNTSYLVLIKRNIMKN